MLRVRVYEKSVPFRISGSKLRVCGIFCIRVGLVDNKDDIPFFIKKYYACTEGYCKIVSVGSADPAYQRGVFSALPELGFTTCTTTFFIKHSSVALTLSTV